MPTPWKSSVRQVQPNSPITAANTNQASDDLTSRDNYLKEQLENAELGASLKDAEGPCSTDVLVGHAVYWNDDNDRYEPAIAEIDSTGSGNPIAISKKAYVVGVVQSKATSTLCTLVLLGKAAVDLTLSVTDPTEAGPLYLSAQFAGKMTYQKPPVGIYVGYNFGNGTCVFNPNPREVIEDHIHYKFDLETRPCGRVTVTANVAEFVCYDDTYTGWLPADASTWAANDITPPTDALFGYNLFSGDTRDSELLAVFPPIPTGNVYLEIDGAGVNPAFYTVDTNNIWWLNDCASNAAGTPWGDTATTGTCSPTTPPAARRDGASLAACPVTAPRRMTLWFTKMVYKTSDAVVSSLTADEPLVVKSALTGAESSTGHLNMSLELDLDSGTNLSSSEEVGYAFKAVDSTNSAVLRKGAVVTKIINGSPGPLTVATNETTGSVTLTVASLNDALSGSVELVALNNVREELYQDIPYLSMDADVDSSLIVKVAIPKVGTPTKSSVNLMIWLMGTVANQTIPSIAWTCKQLVEPASCLQGGAESMGGAVSLGSDSDLECGFDAGTLLTQFADAYDYTLARTASVGEVDADWVNPGDILIFKLSRASDDSYTGNIGIVNMYYSLTALA